MVRFEMWQIAKQSDITCRLPTLKRGLITVSLFNPSTGSSSISGIVLGSIYLAFSYIYLML